MRVFVLANNWVGWQAVQVLRAQGDEIVGLALHEPGKRRYGIETATEAGLRKVYNGEHINDPETIAAIAALKPDACLSVFFGYILRAPFLAAFPNTLNLHPAYLPYGRGANPNVWAIVERTPAGATLHYVDAGVDTGDIVAQLQVAIAPTDTGETLYGKLELACVDLLSAAWPAVRAGKAPRTPQPPGGTAHRTSELRALDALDLDAPTTARALLDRLRARTFPPYSGCYFEAEAGRRAYVRVELAEPTTSATSCQSGPAT